MRHPSSGPRIGTSISCRLTMASWLAAGTLAVVTATCPPAAVAAAEDALGAPVSLCVPPQAEATLLRAFAAFADLVADLAVDLAVDLAAIAGSPEKLIQIPAAATSAANPALLIRMAISPFARATSNDEKTGAEWLQHGRKREFCDRMP